ncbi:SWP70-like protein, partial [Mya arenaria]
VITSSIGLQNGVKKAEEFLNIDGVTDMDFNTYFEIVKNNVLNSETKQHSTISSPFNDTIKTCWRVCNYERNHKSSSFTSEHGMLLWRLYNFLSETDADGKTLFPIELDPEEAVLLFRGFIDVTGQRSKEGVIETFLKETGDKTVTFSEMLNVFERDLVVGLSGKNISAGLHELFDTYISNVLIKGMMWKRGFKHKSWKERWLILTPAQLRYYVSQNEKVLKGTIVFDEECTIEVPPDRPTNKPNRFIIKTQKKPYDMSAHDIKIKNEWVSAITQALGRVGKDPNLQREEAIRRCCARKQRRDEATEAERRRREEEELSARRQQELDEEKRRRLETEARLAEETALREAEQARLRELEEIRRQLERLLEEERQAKKDEEIVRNLQSKLLEEEFERRAELERLQAQQAALLDAEREQKAALEGDRKLQEQLLAEARERLEQLDAERRMAAEKMKEAAEKLQRAEKDRKILEEKARLWRQPVGLARLITPSANPHITHRGVGAFCDRDFVRKGTEQAPSMSGDNGGVSRTDNENDGKEEKSNKVNELDDLVVSETDSPESTNKVNTIERSDSPEASFNSVSDSVTTGDKGVGGETECTNKKQEELVGKTHEDLVHIDNTEETRLEEHDVAVSPSEIHGVNDQSDSESDDESNCAHVQEQGTDSLEQDLESGDNESNETKTEQRDGEIHDIHSVDTVEDQTTEEIPEQINELAVDEKTKQTLDDEKQQTEYLFSDETEVVMNGNVISQEQSESNDDNTLGSNEQITCQADKTVVTCEKDSNSEKKLTNGNCNDISVTE